MLWLSGGLRVAASSDLQSRISALPWGATQESLANHGFVNAGPVLDPEECSALIELFGDDANFRSRVVMGQHNFGEGEYAYFADPIPALVATLRKELYARVAPVANRWANELRRDERYPAGLTSYLKQCGGVGQTKPTPLLLHYRTGGYNRLHRDRYGELQFPIQGMVMLSRPGSDFEGGEFLLVENRPRQQSLGQALSPKLGELVLFAGGERPAPGRRGSLRASVRHGTSRITSGERFTLGVIFHNAA